jgi:hypothetical protein
MSTIISDNTTNIKQRKRNNNGDNNLKTRTQRKNVANNNNTVKHTTDTKKTTRVKKYNTRGGGPGPGAGAGGNGGKCESVMRDNNDKKRHPRSFNPFLAVPTSVTDTASSPTALSFSPTFNSVKKSKNTGCESNGGFGIDHDDKNTNINNNIFLAKSVNNQNHFQENHDSPQYFNKNRANETSVPSPYASAPDNGTNYFIHNSKIQHHRRQQAPGVGGRAHHVVEKTKTNEHIIATIDIQNTVLFPSLKPSAATSTSATSTSATSTSASSVWTKNKIKDIILATVDVASTSATGALVAPVAVASINTENKQICESIVSSSSHAYDPPCKAKNTQPFLSRDNIFLAAFYPSSTDTIETLDTVSDSTTKTNDFTASLVDTCDTRYDRLYDMVK